MQTAVIYAPKGVQTDNSDTTTYNLHNINYVDKIYVYILGRKHRVVNE